MIVVTELTPGLTEAYTEIGDLMISVATGRSPQRGDAQRYTLCRQALLQDRERAQVPGFVIQCASIAKFIDFITLFDPEPSVREQFVRAAFDRIAAPAAPVAPARARPLHRRDDIFDGDFPVARLDARYV